MTKQAVISFCNEHHAAQPLSAVGSVTRGGEVVFSQSYGYADRAARTGNTRRTRFRIGSVTKQFTAADYITMRHLLQHTAGIPSDKVLPDYAKLLRRQVKVDELLSRFESMPLLFEPGTRFAYGNTGYVLLGRIIETLRGSKLPKVFDALVFRPLGMEDTSFDPSPGHARGYEVADGVITDVGDMSMSLFGAAGGLYSTVEDLDRWSQWLYAGACDAMFDDWIETGAAYRAGYGVVNETRNGKNLCYIGGGVPGFSAIAMHDMDGGVHVNIVSNLTDRNYDALAFALLARAS